jgi:hypothetical protein
LQKEARFKYDEIVLITFLGQKQTREKVPGSLFVSCASSRFQAAPYGFSDRDMNLNIPDRFAP